MRKFKTLDPNIVKPIIEAYRKTKGEYPTSNALDKLRTGNTQSFPSIRWIQRHGGIINFYRSLGIEYSDARTGARRSSIATSANKKSQSNDVDFSRWLVATFGESNVHWQSPYNKGVSGHRSDFRVYTKTSSFFVDLFFPQDIESLMGCVNIKIKKLSTIPVEPNINIYFVCCNNDTIDPYLVSRYIQSRKNPVPPNIHLVHVSEIKDVIQQQHP